MFKKIQSGPVILGLLLSLVAMSSNASTTFKRCYAASKVKGIAASRVPCDFTFTSTGSFSCTGGFPQTGTYTIRNNAPVPININYIRIQNNDALPASSVTITANTCGASLAPGASCSVTVSLANSGPFSRILQIGVNSRQFELDSSVITPTTGCNVPTPGFPSITFPCALGSTSTFAVLAGTTITNTGPTVLNGNLGLSPGTSVTGFPPGVVNGTQHITDATAATAKTDLTTLFNCLAAQPCTTTIGTTDQAGVTLTSSGVGAVNVYCSGSSILNSGTLTLSGDSTSIFIFQAGTTLTMNPGASIVLTGGAVAANVFWQVGSSATLDIGSVFKGTIAASASITMNTGATLTGRVLAETAAVTFDTNTTNLP